MRNYWAGRVGAAVCYLLLRAQLRCDTHQASRLWAHHAVSAPHVAAAGAGAGALLPLARLFVTIKSLLIPVSCRWPGRASLDPRLPCNRCVTLILLRWRLLLLLLMLVLLHLLLLVTTVVVLMPLGSMRLVWLLKYGSPLLPWGSRRCR